MAVITHVQFTGPYADFRSVPAVLFSVRGLKTYLETV